MASDGRYVIETIYNLEIDSRFIQDALNKGSSNSWELVSFVLNVKDNQFVIIWDKSPKS